MTDQQVPVNATFQTRYCAFVDILGFRESVGRLEASELLSILEITHRPDQGAELGKLFGTEIKTSSFSDNICISAELGLAGLFMLFVSLEELALRLLDRGALLRGGIVKGLLYHKDNVVFGDALVSAYQLESQHAVYPRILVTREVALEAHSLGGALTANQLLPYVLSSDDGPFFLNVLRHLTSDLTETNQNRPHDFARYRLIARRLQEGLNTTVDTPRHFAKHQWFARYWNRMLPDTGANELRLHGPGTQSGTI